MIYNLDFITEKGELYINKKVQLRKSKRLLMNNTIRKTYSDNLIMIKYNGQLKALYIPIAKYHYNRKREISQQKFDQEILTHNFVYTSFFVDITSYPTYIVTFEEKKMSNQYPVF